MCGIVGYVGDQDAVSVLIESLKRLEYRGYDSSGLATVSASGGALKLDVLKSIGYVSNLERKAVSKGANIGISHTRWATHGPPNEANAHPHTDCDGSIAVVHNGIIDNHLSLKQEMMDRKHTFRSDTDSEVIPHLIEEEYRKSGGDLFEAVRLAVGRLEGSFAIVTLHRDHPDRIVCARRLSPMVLGRAVHQGYVASDVTALLKHTNRFLYMEDGEIAEVTADEIRVEKIEGGVVKRDWISVDWSVEDAEKGGFEHYMIKEIFEQPRSLHQTLTGWRSERADLPRNLVTARSIKIVACGTSYHAGLLGKYLFERFTGLPTQVEMASEYRYADPTSDDPLVILITQSGETADTTAAAREARRRGMRTISVTNVVGSSITRETDIPIYLRSGPEIGVAASKTFTSQLMIMYLLSSHIGFNMGRLNSEEGSQNQYSHYA